MDSVWPEGFPWTWLLIGSAVAVFILLLDAWRQGRADREKRNERAALERPIRRAVAVFNLVLDAWRQARKERNEKKKQAALKRREKEYAERYRALEEKWERGEIRCACGKFRTFGPSLDSVILDFGDGLKHLSADSPGSASPVEAEARVKQASRAAIRAGEKYGHFSLEAAAAEVELTLERLREEPIPKGDVMSCAEYVRRLRAAGKEVPVYQHPLNPWDCPPKQSRD